MSLKKLCRYTGCTHYRDESLEYSNFCKEHQEWARVRDVKRKEERFEKYSRRTDFHRDSKWQKFSREYLKEHQVCEICGDRATEVHHIIPVADCEELGYDEDNLKALCKKCHAKITNHEIFGRKKYL